MKGKFYARPAAALVFVSLFAAAAAAQTTPQSFGFRPGQSVYIVAFTRALVPVVDVAGGRIELDLPDDFFDRPEGEPEPAAMMN